MATIKQPPLRYTSSTPRSAPRSGTASTPGSAPRSGPARPQPQKAAYWPVNQHQRSGDTSVAHCILRLDALPVRYMCADERSVYLAEAPLRHAGHPTPGGHTGRLTARDRNGRVTKQLAGAGNALSCLLVTRDERIWAGSFDGLVRICRLDGRPLHEARAHSDCVHAIAEAMEAVFSSGGDFLVRAWSASLVPLRTLRAHSSGVHCLAAPAWVGIGLSSFSEAGCGAWSGGDDGVVHVWSDSEAAGFAHIACIDDFGAPVRVLAAQNCASPRVWAADVSGALRVYDARSRSVLRTVRPGPTAPPTTCIACSTTAVWTGDAAGCITVYDGGTLHKLQRLDGVHLGAVGGLASALGSRDGGGVWWSWGADCSVRAWNMSERMDDRMSRTREAIDGQHSVLSMMRSMLPRAAAATTGRIEAAAQRSEMLSRRLLDLEVSMSIGSELRAASSATLATADGTYATSRADVLAGYTAANSDGIATGGEHGDQVAEEGRRRVVEYDASVDALNLASREVATELEESLLALRGRIDEMLAVVQGGGESASPARAFDPDAGARVLNAPMWATASPRGKPSGRGTPRGGTSTSTQ